MSSRTFCGGFPTATSTKKMVVVFLYKDWENGARLERRLLESIEASLELIGKDTTLAARACVPSAAMARSESVSIIFAIERRAKNARIRCNGGLICQDEADEPRFYML